MRIEYSYKVEIVEPFPAGELSTAGQGRVKQTRHCRAIAYRMALRRFATASQQP
jgi:hypothetical protein